MGPAGGLAGGIRGGGPGEGAADATGEGEGPGLPASGVRWVRIRGEGQPTDPVPAMPGPSVRPGPPLPRPARIQDPDLHNFLR